MNIISRLITNLSNWTTVLAGIAVVAMMLQITIDVALRDILGKPLVGTLTIVSYYYMVIVAFVPLALAEKNNSHISVDFITGLMPERIQHHLAGAMLIPSAAIGFILTWRSFDAALVAMQMNASQISGYSRILIWPAYFTIPLGAGLMTAIIALKFVSYATGKKLEGLQND